MIIDKFLQSFELLTDTKVGIKRLRELILQMATQGLIVNQDPKDGNALQELSLIDSTEISERLIGDSVHPSQYPSSWAGASFPNIGKWIGGNGFPTSHQGHKGLDILFCKVSDMNLPSNSKFILETINTIDMQTAKKLRVNILPEGTVIFPKIGGAIATNKRRLISKLTVMDNNCMGLVPSSAIDSEWLFLLLSSIDMTQYQTGTSIPSLSQRILDQIRFGVPPIKEQRRIVKKVNELFLLCNELEIRIDVRDKFALSARKSAVDAIATSQTPEDLRMGWDRIKDNWELIAGTPESIESLRGLILDLAVTGRLTTLKLQTTDLITRDNDLSETSWSKFAPKNWNLVTLGAACLKISDGTHKTPKYQETGVPFLSIKDISAGFIDFSKTRFISESEHEDLCKRIKPSRGDILFCRIGTLGRAITIETDREFSIFVSLGLLRPKPDLNPKFLELALNSPISHKQFESIKAGGSHTQKLNLGAMSQYVIWYPDLSTQSEIVQQVSNLMELCDELETMMIRAEDAAHKFARSVVSVSA